LAEQRAKIDAFFAKFDGLEIENHETPPKRIKVKLSKPQHTFGFNDDVTGENEQYLLEFEGFDGYSAPEINENYAWFRVDYNKMQIIPENVLITNPLLKSNIGGKGVFPTIRRFIGTHFPNDFTYLVMVSNYRAKNEFFGIFNQVSTGRMSREKGEELIRKHYKIQERISAGFNDIIVTLVGALPIIECKKSSDLQEPRIKVVWEVR
jgi:hypothetical protein